MARPLSASQLVKALKAEGVRVKEHEGWRTHNRNHKGPWGPVNGVVLHHSVTSGTDTSVRLCRDGHGALPGPLCHGVLAKDGTLHLIGNGRTNHAGKGDGSVLRRVIRELGGYRPKVDDTDGNTHFYGFEMINLGNGKDPWPKAQLEAAASICAAICKAHGWSEQSVLGHKEWTRTKIDPRGFEMSDMRQAVKDKLHK